VISPGIDEPVVSRKRRLQKNDKLKTKQDFDFLKENGKRVTHPYYTLLVVPDCPAGFGLGIICSRKFHKHAVVRNRARRILSEAVRLLKPRMQSCRILLIPRRKICSATMPQVRDSLENALIRAGIRIQNTESDPGSPLPESR
jgi:ribonuclease P protein component